MLGRIQARRFAALLLIIVFGLTLRRFGYAAGLPFFLVKYGGSLLWGSMVYVLLALAVTALTARMPPAGIAALALAVAICVEFFRLYHTPGLDAFRLTTAGALLLGRVFSPWNILAYAIGIAAAYAFDPAHRPSSPERR
ncbi:DUF2809 domain-containing protein [Rhizobium sp. MC63]|uniref:DUF2809 domain-containing protein n=1 Tax=Rhizobium mulingense TaxID=3031128 RepID=A0ACC6N0K2_9HYPH|nr:MULTISPECIES: DUF2809 domain-containing protein [unclassified Rhizobium]MDF0698882.1 DUF2809 domain-containing protein [Rhizobium sp. MC63]MEA3518942.1 DUF2809 domain-containing protein [Rhizobium sp. MJ31]MEB3046894.1 DUF2809 domain-containing protein [Rhizobium sp. MJ21]